MRRSAQRSALILAAAAAAAAPAAAQFGPPRPEPITAPDPARLSAAEQAGFEQRLGARVPMTAPLVDEAGRPVTLSELGGGRPIVLVPAYYDCPMLCSMVLTGVVSSLGTLRLEPGRDFEVAVVSFDPEETPAMAAAAAARHLARYRGARGDEGPAGAEASAGFHFLTGEEAAVRSVMDAIGFGYAYVPERGEWAHATGIVTLTPDGTVARYHYGVEFPPRDLRLGLIEAAAGRIGNPVDEVLLYCLRYDPGSGRYSLAILNLVRAGGVATVAGIGLFLFTSRRRGRRAAGSPGGPQGA
jgi:protein SCO1/2